MNLIDLGTHGSGAGWSARADSWLRGDLTGLCRLPCGVHPMAVGTHSAKIRGAIAHAHDVVHLGVET
jgi:hypothetical protein